MITAREAIALTQETLLKSVFDKIEAQARVGNSSVYWPDLPGYVIDELEKNGFVYKTLISWETS